MSPSWNFPARAEPSYDCSESSRAELGSFIYELKPSWIFFCILLFIASFFSKSVILRRKSITCHKENRKQSENASKIRKKNAYFRIFQLIFYVRADFFYFRAEQKRPRAELKLLQLELWLEPARLGLITRNYKSIDLPYFHLGHCMPTICIVKIKF